MTGVDDAFSTDLDHWRMQLARAFYKANKHTRLINDDFINPLLTPLDKAETRYLDIVKYCTHRLLTRIIISRLAEEKGLIESGRLLKIKTRWETCGTRKPLINILNEYFHRLYNIFPIALFHKDTIIENAQINSKILSAVIRATYEYELTELDSNILGKLHETNIGSELVLINQKLAIQPKDDLQKTRGIFYTPQYIIDFILKHTLEQKLNEIYDKFQTFFENGNPKTARQAISHLKAIKILDPACGAGAFLLTSFTLLRQYYQQIYQRVQGESEKPYDLIILTENLFGVDLDPHATDITTINLLMKSMSNSSAHLSLIQKNIRTGNSIYPFTWETEFSPILNHQKFTFVIGNPPYIAWNKIQERKILETGTYLDLEYDCRPNHKDAQPNLYLFFLVRAINLVKEGRIGFILPQEWRFENSARKFRNYLLAKANAIQIIRFNPQFKIFTSLPSIGNKKIGTTALILFIDITEHKAKERFLVEYYLNDLDEAQIAAYLADFDKLEKHAIKIVKKFSDLIDNPWVFARPPEEQLKRKIESYPNTVRLNDPHYFKVRGGFQPPVNTIYHFQISEDDLQDFTKAEQQYVFPAIFSASEIQRYIVDRQDHYWIILNDIAEEDTLKTSLPNLYRVLVNRLDTSNPAWWKFPNIRNFELIKSAKMKLLSPRTASQNTFCLDDKKSVFKGTNTFIISMKLDPYYLLGILNSRLADFWYSKFGFEYHGTKTKKYEPQKIRAYSIPIILPPDTARRNSLIRLVKKCISLKKKTLKNHTEQATEFEKLEDQINQIVYSLYNLTEHEIRLVEK
ncbi:MAG: Eco57I restriction-modification methylase domain-containing protein [Candidatus Helarchaeota archaeon]